MSKMEKTDKAIRVGVTVSLRLDQMQWIKTMEQESGLKVSAIVRQAVDAYIEQQSKETEQGEQDHW